MTPAGWVLMTLSVTLMVSLLTFCYYKLLTGAGDPGTNLDGDSCDPHS